MLFPSFFLLPLVVLVALIVLGSAFRQSRRARWMVAGSLMAAAAAGTLNVWVIFHSTSSTAAIGILFVPWVMSMAAPVGALLGLMAHEARFRTSSMWGVISMAGLAGVVVLAGMAGWRIVEFRKMQGETDGAALERAARAKLAGRDYFVLSAIAANAKTPAGTLLEIARYPDAGLHEKRSEWIDAYDRDQLAVVRKVIRNPGAPVEALVTLSESKNEYVRGDVAQERRTPAEVLRKLARAPHGYLVDWGLAVNPSTPVEILTAMPYEKDATIAGHLARNTATPPELLEKLAGHKDAMVRGSVVGNSAAPESALRILARDGEEWVARQAQRRLRQRR